MLQDPISKPPDAVMDMTRPGADHRRSKPNGGASEQVLKCPRCDSLNTKFCYYNNYSLTQPRHFCKNCRRYWTQGGSLRNVPIGGGCRKNKRVKQRAIDSHLFPGIDDHGGPGSFLMQHTGPGGPNGLLPASCFVGGATASAIPGGYSDLIVANDAHLLSMAFSRLQDSYRAGSHEQPGSVPFPLMHLAPSLYESAALAGTNFLKPESHRDHLGSKLLDQPVAPSSGALLGSSSGSGGTLVSIENEQIANFGVSDAFSSQLDAQLKMQQQRAHAHLALHLGGGGASGGNTPGITDHHMQNSGGCGVLMGSCPIVEDNAPVGSSHEERFNLDAIHHRHHALPAFEDQESPENMNGNVARRSAGHYQNRPQTRQPFNLQRCLPESIADGRSPSTASGSGEGWQHVTSSGTPEDHQSRQLGRRLGLHSAYSHTVPNDHHHQMASSSHASAPDHQQISFWTPSPWSTNNPDMHTGALL
ncbi:hypothetical protein KP509_14G083700 [Ceratopteris richardii]|uniref:Dof-type domain-containing protein n=1 Tax=Ceratopteris richardii TaxID=49495 RepID=A0A8T2TGZ8_CERRI|nr:hypothetical protein KP509_14G083700 [Ceratopteris richardii]